jgi:predicted permease
MLSHIRFAARTLAKTPGLSLSAILLLAFGIGGGTLLFSAFESVWLRPLPVRHPEQLVRVVQRTPQLGSRSYFPYPYYRALREHSTTLASAFGEEEWVVAMNRPAPAEQVRVRLVTPEFFDELGAHALLGRVLSPDDTDAVVISYGFWQRHFQGDPRVIGQSIMLHGYPFTIAGVMPSEFNGLSADNTPEIRATLHALPRISRHPDETLELMQLDLAARIKPGVSRGQALDESRALWRPAVEDWYAKQRLGPAAVQSELRRGMNFDPLERGVSIVRDKYGDAVRLAAAASGLLLLMVSANVAGLLLAGAAARRGEIAVRLALGATPARLARQMLVESLLLVLIGASCGWALTWLSAPVLVRHLPPLRDLATTLLPVSIDFRPDPRVMLAALAAAILTAVLVAIAPTWSASRMNLDAVLRGVRASRGWAGRRGLVVFQVALCTVLITGAGLLVRSFRELRAVPPGFDSAHIATFTTDPGLTGYTPDQSRAFWLNLRARVRDLPGVVSVGLAARPLMRGSGVKTTVTLPGQTATPEDFLNTSINGVSPEYFDAMGMTIVRGRAFTPADIDAKNPIPAIVNEAFVRRFFPDRDPIGQRFGISADSSRVVVGIVRDAKYRSLREPMTPTFYSPDRSDFSVLCVRTIGNPEALIEPVRKALAVLDPALPFTEIHTLAAEVEASAAPERLTATLAASFGAFAALLAAAGIYGLLAFSVEQRRREIGIRMALGARPRQVGAMLGRQTAAMLAMGIALGLAAALLLTGSLRTVLYQVSPGDPLSMILAAGLMCAVAAAATAIPARRATRVHPATALRDE